MSADEKVERFIELAGDSSVYGLSDAEAVEFYALQEEIRAAMREAVEVCR